MKIYIAGASKEISTCESFRDRLRTAGHVITHDWMREIRECTVADHELTHEARHEYALMDLRGVLAADLLWVVCPDAKSVGCWVELGIALGCGRPMVALSGPWAPCIFADLAAWRFSSHEAAFEWIVNEAERAA